VKKLQITIIKEASLFTSRWKQFKKKGIPMITPIWLLKSPYKIFKKYLHEVSQSPAVTKRNGFPIEMKRTLLSD